MKNIKSSLILQIEIIGIAAIFLGAFRFH